MTIFKSNRLRMIGTSEGNLRVCDRVILVIDDTARVCEGR
jgi:hypothetical protein